MNSKEEIFDQILKQLQNGRTVEEVLLDFPEYQQELSPLLQTAQQLLKFPKLSAPHPQMRRKFMAAPARVWAIRNWAFILRFSAVSMAVLLFVTSIAGTAYATLKSLPGQTLFPLKRTAEKIQLSFTTDPIAKANMQVAIAQKRLSDAEMVFSNPEKTPAQEIAALNELSAQTKVAATTVQTAAAATPLSGDHPIVNTFSDVTQKQQQLLSKIQGQKDVSVAANSALEATTEAKKTIAVVAATYEQASLTKLSNQPNTATVSGTVKEYKNNILTVDKTTVTISDSAEIKTADGRDLKPQDISVGDSVTVVYTKDSQQLASKHILVESSPENSTASTSSSTIATVAPKPEILKPKIPETSTSSTKTITAASSTAAEADPNAAVGGFIPEDPSPQFSP